MHVEVVGPDPDQLLAFSSALFGWDVPPGAPVASEVSDVESYSFIVPPDGASAPAGGIGGGAGFPARVVVSGLMTQLVWQPIAAEVRGLAMDEDRLIDSTIDLLLHGLRPSVAAAR